MAEHKVIQQQQQQLEQLEQLELELKLDRAIEWAKICAIGDLFRIVRCIGLDCRPAASLEIRILQRGPQIRLLDFLRGVATGSGSARIDCLYTRPQLVGNTARQTKLPSRASFNAAQALQRHTTHDTRKPTQMHWAAAANCLILWMAPICSAHLASERTHQMALG